MKPGWRNLVVLLSALFLSATGALAVENRFLLVVEASADSAKNIQATRNAVADLLIKGFTGIAKAGDTVGIWIAGERLDTTFPMWVWEPAAVGKYAVHADAFIAKRHWTGRWNPADTAAALKAVAANSDALTVVLVTAPGSRLVDLPFSENIAAIQDKAAPDLERTKLPFVTFATVREREFVSAVVNSGVGPWTIPHPPLPKSKVTPTPTSAPKPVMASKSIVGNATGIGFQTTPPPRQIDLKPAAEAPPAPAPELKPTTAIVAETKAPAEPKPASAVPQPAPVQKETPPVAEKPMEKPTPAPAPAPAQQSPNPVAAASVTTETPKPVPPTAVIPTPEPPATISPAPVAPETAAPIVVPSESRTAPASTPATVAVVAASQGGGGGFLVAGIASVLGLALLGWMAFRRPKAAPRSLITESYRSK